MELIAYSIESPLEGVCKQYWIGLHYEPNRCAPLVFLQKPKWVPEDKWRTIVEAIRIDLDPAMFNDMEPNK